MENTDKQNENRPWLWKKGQSGNPKGRPKGKSMKEYARERLAKMTPQEREEFLEGIDKRTVWEMGEGKPETNIKAEVDIKKLIELDE